MSSWDHDLTASVGLERVVAPGSAMNYKPDYEAELAEMTAWLDVQIERLRPSRDIRNANLYFKLGRLAALLAHMQLPVQQTEDRLPG